MKTSLTFISLIGLVFLSTLCSNGQKTDFSGEWALDRTKSVVPDNQLFLVKISIKVKGDSLLTLRTYEMTDGQQYPFNENVSMDGKDCKTVVYDMPRKAKANWSVQDASLIYESTTTITRNADTTDLVTKETWKVDKSKNALSIDFKNTFPEGETSGTFLFNKVTN
jgi:hypothetical protein